MEADLSCYCGVVYTVLPPSWTAGLQSRGTGYARRRLATPYGRYGHDHDLYGWKSDGQETVRCR